MARISGSGSGPRPPVQGSRPKVQAELFQPGAEVVIIALGLTPPQVCVFATLEEGFIVILIAENGLDGKISQSRKSCKNEC